MVRASLRRLWLLTTASPGSPIRFDRPNATVVLLTTALMVAAPAVFLLASWVYLARAARSRTHPPERLPTVPVALILGAQMHPGGRPSTYLRARLDLALRLYRLGKVERFITSGDDGPGSNHESRGMANYLVDKGVPVSAITVDPGGVDTYQSCRRARDLYGERHLVVVSQSFHLPRALAMCRWLGIDAWAVADTSVRHINNGRNWRWGHLREVGALVKLVADLLTNRPVAGGRLR